MDDDKRATVQEMKQRFDENNAKLRNVSLSLPHCPGAPGTVLSLYLIQGPVLLLLLQLESQKRTNEASLRRAAYTAAQLDEMPEDVATYRSVGKA